MGSGGGLVGSGGGGVGGGEPEGANPPPSIVVITLGLRSWKCSYGPQAGPAAPIIVLRFRPRPRRGDPPVRNRVARRWGFPPAARALRIIEPRRRSPSDTWSQVAGAGESGAQ